MSAVTLKGYQHKCTKESTNVLYSTLIYMTFNFLNEQQPLNEVDLKPL